VQKEGDMRQDRASRFNVQLDDEHAARLHAIAERTYVAPGSLARSLLQAALDNADPDAPTVTALLNSIPGALDRAQAGLAAARVGRLVALEDL
jgi:predicted transcriptional regulator